MVSSNHLQTRSMTPDHIMCAPPAHHGTLYQKEVCPVKTTTKSLHQNILPCHCHIMSKRDYYHAMTKQSPQIR